MSVWSMVRHTVFGVIIYFDLVCFCDMLHGSLSESGDGGKGIDSECRWYNAAINNNQAIMDLGTFGFEHLPDVIRNSRLARSIVAHVGTAYRMYRDLSLVSKEGY